jgi:hypothetical protein
LSPVAGDQEYVVAPLAVSAVLLPLQIVPLPDVEIVGEAFTVTAIVFVALQLLLVPVIVYVMFAVIEVMTVAPVFTFSPVVGVHV